MLGLEIYHQKYIDKKAMMMKKETIVQPIVKGIMTITPEDGCVIVLRFIELEDK